MKGNKMGSLLKDLIEIEKFSVNKIQYLNK